MLLTTEVLKNRPMLHQQWIITNIFPVITMVSLESNGNWIHIKSLFDIICALTWLNEETKIDSYVQPFSDGYFLQNVSKLLVFYTTILLYYWREDDRTRWNETAIGHNGH